MQSAIRVDSVSKKFKLPHEKYSGLKQAVLNFGFGRKYEMQQVLNDVSFDIKKGEFFGIVGRNGSGKSTLLKILAQIYTPDSGAVTIDGALTPFIELGVGFNPELTGKENIYLNGALLGFDRKMVDEIYDEIVDFAELHKFMDQKLKNYSSGMQVRLAFSIAIRAKSDILLIDEVLAVGDAAFQTKCFDYFYDLKKAGTTVVFVSHDVGSLERFCDRGILVDQGRIIESGSIDTVLKAYTKVVLNEMQSADQRGGNRQNSYAEIRNLKISDDAGKKKERFSYGENIHIKFGVDIKKNMSNPIVGITVWQKHLNKAVFAANSYIDGISVGELKKGNKLEFEAQLPDVLNDGEYYIEPAVANESATIFFDQVPRAANFIIAGSKNPHSIISGKSKTKLVKVG